MWERMDVRLQGDAGPGLGAEVALVHRKVVDAGGQQRCRHHMGVGGGVGIDEAAGVRGHSGVEGQGNLRRDLPQFPADLVDISPQAARLGSTHWAAPNPSKEGW